MCIGPVKGFLQTDREPFEAFPIRGKDLLLTPAVGPPCMFLGSYEEEFKGFTVRAVRQAIWTNLAEEMQGDHPRRKDMKGFKPHVNLSATMAETKPPKTASTSIPAKLWQQLQLTVVTGATVAGDKMHAMGHAHSDQCPLDDCRHTAEHLFWHCSAFDNLRRPFLGKIGELV